MAWWNRARRRLRNVLDRQGVEREMDEEMRFHLEMEIEERVRSGVTPEEARRTALRDFGATERFQDEGRDARGIGAMENLSQDVRFTLRTLRRRPGFAAVAILTLALGIGASTAIFSVVNGVLLRALPFPEPDRLVSVFHLNADGSESRNFSHPNFVDVQARARSFTGLSEYSSGLAPVMVGEEATRVPIARVSEQFFAVLGVRPALGRTFEPQEFGTGSPVAVVSDAFWRQRLGAIRDLGAQTVRVGDRQLDIVGVMPPGMAFPADAGVWVPMGDLSWTKRTGHNFAVIGRMREGVTPAEATRELDAIARELKRAYGDDTMMSGALATALHDDLVGEVRPALYVLLGAAGLLLLIACANVVNLLLTRMAARRRELAVRLALGAGRARLMRQFVAESLVLTLVGGALGALLAVVGVRALLALEPGRLPRVGEVRVDGPALLFALAISAVAALGMGVVVALRASDGDVRETLAEGARGQSGGLASGRLRSLLAGGQVALTLVLLVGAGLLARSFVRLISVDPGYRTDGAVVMDILIPFAGDEEEQARSMRFHQELLARLTTIPGVREVGSVNILPLGDGGTGSSGTFLKIDGTERIESFEDFGRLMKDPGRPGDADYRVASAGYFRAMDIPLLRGRLFDERDVPGPRHAAVVSRSLAESAWPGQDPVGKLVQYGGMDGDMRPFVVVGVVGDVRERALHEEPRPVFYANVRQRPYGVNGAHNIVLRGGDPEAVSAAARETLREMNPEIPVRFRTLEEVFSTSLTDRRFSLILLGVFALIALVLAVTGIYGIISYLVAQRTREIGIRLALGASTGRVLSMMVRSGIAMALAGVVAGMAVAVVATRLLTTLLYGVGPTDAATFVAAPLLLVAVAALASYLPARRTTRVDPMIAMRAEQ